jgi:hypothetical protein
LQLASGNYPVDASFNYGIGTGATGNIFATNPFFTDAANGDFTLQAGSSCIDVGTATGAPTTDIAGMTRPQGGGFDIGAYEGTAAPLPVELLYFTGRSVEKGNFLQWETASEENNAGFDIEKSINGRNFEKIGFIAGNGTTIAQQAYEFLDKNINTGVNYYRLKQTDYNGDFEYSNIISIDNQDFSINEVRVYPNPVRDILTIENGEGLAIIYNTLGQPIRQIQITNSIQQVDLSDFPKGIYTLHIQQVDGGSVTKQFVK